jgi:hypothetical protein
MMLDHLVYAAPNLGEAIDEFEGLLGVRAASGGSHPAWGTANALLALGPDVYLEIIGPDPNLARPETGYSFGIDDLAAPRLVSWAVKAPNIEERVHASREGGYDSGPIEDGSRQPIDGPLLRWRLTRPRLEDGVGLVPFLIDWGDTLHPAVNAPCGVTFVSMRAEHPEPARVSASLEALDVELSVELAPLPRLLAVVLGEKGEITLS